MYDAVTSERDLALALAALTFAALAALAALATTATAARVGEGAIGRYVTCFTARFIILKHQ